MPIVELMASKKESILNTGGKTHGWEEQKEFHSWAYNPVQQFAPIDELKHHVNLGLASSDLNEEGSKYMIKNITSSLYNR